MGKKEPGSFGPVFLNYLIKLICIIYAKIDASVVSLRKLILLPKGYVSVLQRNITLGVCDNINKAE